MRWRLMQMVAAVAMAGVLIGTTAADADDYYQEGFDASSELEMPGEAYDSTGDTWSQVGWGTLTVLSNVVYVPAKLVYASLGCLTGGLALGLTGGDLATAQSIWEPSLGGDYFLTPGMIQGEEGVSFAGAPADLTTVPAEEPAQTEHGDERYGS